MAPDSSESIAGAGRARLCDAHQMQVIIRPAASSDAAAAELYLRARRAGSAKGTIPPLAHGDEDVRYWIAHVVIPRLECWLALRVSGPVVGMLVLEADWIDQLYVDPDLTRAGIRLRADRRGQARTTGRAAALDVRLERRRAALLLRHGFREVERTDGSSNEEGAPAIQLAWNPT